MTGLQSYRQLAEQFYSELETVENSTPIWMLSNDAIQDFQITPLSQFSDNIWQLPFDWVSPSNRRPHVVTVDFYKVASGQAPPRIAKLIVADLKRLYLISVRVTVRHKERTFPPCMPATWVKMAQLMLPTAFYAYSLMDEQQRRMSPPGELYVFKFLRPEQMEILKTEFPSCLAMWTPRLNAYLADGLYLNWPAIDVSKPVPNPRENSRASDHFSDEALTKIISSAFWLDSICEDLTDAYFDLKDVAVTKRERTSHIYRSRRTEVSQWESGSLIKGKKFPFKLRLTGTEAKAKLFDKWPVDTVHGIISMLFLCQTARMIILLISTGMRIGEVSSLGRDSVVWIDEKPYLAGMRFKDSEAYEGEKRKWPLPEICAAVIERQLAFLDRFDEDNGSLWRSFSKKTSASGLVKAEHAVKRYGEVIFVDEDTPLSHLDGQITAHRFRYSIARLIALTLSGAPQILYNVLGHDRIETTMGYALQDPDFHDTVNRIRAEVKAVRVDDVLKNADGAGGRGGQLSRQLVQRMQPVDAHAELGTDDMAVAAKILGDAELVRPGVLCLAQPMERGVCSTSVGIRDVAACTPSCVHRLEVAAQRDDRRSKINYILSKMSDAPEGSLPFYQGQLFACFEAFPELIDECDNKPRLIEILRQIDSATWDACRDEVKTRLAGILG